MFRIKQSFLYYNTQADALVSVRLFLDSTDLAELANDITYIFADNIFRCVVFFRKSLNDLVLCGVIHQGADDKSCCLVASDKSLEFSRTHRNKEFILTIIM